MKTFQLIGGIAVIFALIAAVAYATSGFTSCPLAQTGASSSTGNADVFAQTPGAGCCGMRSAAAPIAPAASVAPVAPTIDGKKQTLCPIMGGPINKKLFVDVQGKRIYICCPGCTDAIRADPQAALKKIAENGEEAESLAQ